mmetsp:Transcript_16147/g.37079  ORF Transcript_16147/g.37079 Transcript_16147/m.37079 type:complete len:94 (-) Transcript_16147:25-306(-)
MPILYILTYEYAPDVLEKRGPHREGHVALAKELCLSAGPTGPPGMKVPTGALLIFKDKESAMLFVEKDPYVSAGIVTGHNIQEWNVVIENTTK